MKKYCLTECFKRKMSKRWQLAIEVGTAIGMTFLVVIAGAAISAGTGFIMIFLDQYFLWGMEWQMKNMVSLGFLFLLLTFLGTVGLYLVYEKLSPLPKKITKFVKDRYEGEPFECSIFEECKDQ